MSSLEKYLFKLFAHILIRIFLFLFQSCKSFLYILDTAFLSDTQCENVLFHVCVCVSHSVMSNSLRPHGLQPTRLLCPWDSPGKNTGVDCHSLLQRIFPTQGSNPGLPHCRQILYHLSNRDILYFIPYCESFFHFLDFLKHKYF